MQNAENSEDVGTLQALEYLDSLEAKINQVQVAYQQFYTTIGIEDAWKGALGFVRQFIDSLNSLPKVFDKIPINAANAIFTVVSLAKNSLLGLLAQLASQFRTILEQMKVDGMRIGREIGEQTGKAANEGMSRQLAGVSDTLKDTGKWKRNVEMIGQAFVTLGLAINKSSEAGRVFSGVLTGLGGAVQIASGIAKGWAGLPQIISGALNVINGISLGIESTEEKIERLTKEAETLSNAAKQAKADERTLNNSIEKIKELEQKRYDSAESAEEYQAAVEELADSFPELISGLTSSGEALIDMESAEALLEEARRKTAQATYEAIDAERKTKKEQNKALEENIRSYSEFTKDDIELQDNFIEADSGKSVQQFYALRNAYKQLGGKEDDFSLSNFISNLASIKGPFQEILKGVLDNGYTEDLAAQAARQSINESVDESGLKQQYLDILDLYIKPFESADIDFVYDFFAGLKDEKLDSDEFLSRYNNFLSQIASLPQVTQEYIEEQFDISNLTQQIQGLRAGYRTELALNKTSILYYINTIKNSYKDIFDSTNNIQYLANILDAAAEGQDIDEFLKSNQADKIINNYINNYNKLSAQQKEIWKNLDITSMTAAQMVRALSDVTDAEGIPQEFENLINEYAINTTEQLHRITKAFGGSVGRLNSYFDSTNLRNLYNSIKQNLSDELDPAFTQFIISQGSHIKQLEKDGLFDLAQQYTSAVIILNELIASNDTLRPLLSSINLTTREGIDAARQIVLEHEAELGDITDINNALNDMEATIVDNALITIRAVTDSIANKAEDISGIFSKINSGMSYKDASKLVEYMQASLGNTDFNLSDSFTTLGGKYYLAASQVDTVRSSLKNYLDQEATEADAAVGDFVERYGTNWSTSTTVTESMRQKLLTLVTDEQDLGEYISETGALTQKGVDHFVNQYKEVVKGAKEAHDVADTVYIAALQSLMWAQGDYSDVIDGDIRDYLSGRRTYTELNREAIKPAIENAQSGLNTLYSDLLAKGSENLNLADYSNIGIPQEILEEIKEKGLSSAEQFLNDYGQYLGKSAEELADMYIKAIESEESAAKAISGLSASSRGSRVNLASLTSRLSSTILNNLSKQIENYGAKLSENGVLDLGLGADIASIIQLLQAAAEAGGIEITNEALALKDTIAAVLKGYADLIKKGTSGTLTNVEAEALRGFAEQNELGELQFIKTAEGLKLANASALELYNTLKQISPMQAEILWPDLVSNLAKAHTEYKNISTVMAEIARLERELVTASKGEKEQLEGQLKLAKQIANTMTADASQFSFMDRALPADLNNPLNYWLAWDKAFSAINDARQSGYMSVQDFTNLVNEIQSMAIQTGNAMTFMGQTIEADGTGAAELIMRANKALTVVNGKNVVALKNVGSGMIEGTDFLAEQFDSGIRTMAESQIKLIDAEIAMLEAIVAMEELDADHSGVLDLEELFEPVEDGENSKALKALQDQVTQLSETSDDFLAVWDKVTLIDKKGEQHNLGKIMRDIIGGNDISQEDQVAFAAFWNTYWKNFEESGLDNLSGQELLDALKALFEGVLPEGYEVEMKPVVDEEALKKANEEINDSTNTTYPEHDKTVEAKWKEQYDAENAELKLRQRKQTEEESEETPKPIETEINVTPESVKELIEAGETPIERTIDVTINADGDTEVLGLIDNSSEKKTITLPTAIPTGSPYDLGYTDTEATLEANQAALEERMRKKYLELFNHSNSAELMDWDLLWSDDGGLAQKIEEEIKVIQEDQKKHGRQLSYEEQAKRIESLLSGSDTDGIALAGKTEEVAINTGDFIDAAHNIIPEDIDVEYVANTWWNQVVAAFNAWTKSKQATEEQHIAEGPEGPAPSYGDIPDAKEFSENMGKGADSAQEAEEAAEGTAQATENTVQATSETVTLLGLANSAGIDLSDYINEAGEVDFSSIPDDMRIAMVNSKLFAEYMESAAKSSGLISFTGHGGRTVIPRQDTTRAKGNVALASGRRTLMGELGPELYVTNGHYYVAGQNGAEFVDLPDDAIVFNHLQTKRLLSTGHTSHGSPITNERNAISYATGNVTGPALPNASATIEELKKIRAAWEQLAGLTAKELGALGGKSSGGGGGGKDAADNAGYIHDLEIWYNLLRQIAKLEKDITYEEALQSKIQSDRIKNGRALYSSYKRELNDLNDSIERNTELVNLQRDFYLKSIEETNSSVFGKIFTFTDEGLMQYNSDLTDYINDLTKTNSTYFENGKIHIKGTSYVRDDEGNVIENKKGQAQVETFDKVLDTAKSGLDFLAQLQATDENGGAIYTAEEQLEILKAYGFGDILQYDSSGKKLDTSDQNYATNAVKAFFDRFDGIIEENDSLFDSILDTEKQILSQTTQRNEILQKIVDNQIDVENQVLEAIENREQAIIDELQKERDAIKEASDAYIDGLNKQLNNERQMYQNQQDETELSRLRRQLAILQRSGGSAAQISSLQQDISSREQDTYFEAQQQQIDAIKEASDLEIERLDAQLDLMKETLEYEKKNGLLWPEVTEIMKGTPESIVNFIKENSPEYLSQSELQQAEALNDIREKVELWVSNRDDEKNPLDSDATGWNNSFKALEDQYSSYNDIWTEANQAKAKEAYDKEYAQSADPVKANEAAKAVFAQLLSDYKKKNGSGNAGGTSATAGTGTGGAGNSGAGGSGGSGGNASSQDGKRADNERIAGRLTIKHITDDGKKHIDGNKLYEAGTIVKASQIATPSEFLGYVRYKAEPATVKIDPNMPKTMTLYYKKVQIRTHSNNGLRDGGNHPTLSMYSTGGLNDYTGLAMLHGTKTKPEAVLNAEETRMLREDIMSGKSNSLMSLLLDFRDTMSETAGFKEYANLNNSNESVSIGAINLTMQATISNDYDARQAADSAYERILEIARKTGTQGIRR